MPTNTYNDQYLIRGETMVKIADAVRGLTGTNDTLTPAEIEEEIKAYTPAEPSEGGTSVSRNDVNFMDYDGTILYSYSAADALALTELPANPTHEGLTSQGWNWSLANMKTQVTASGKCDIGQMYITDDGKTRIYVHLSEERKSPMLVMKLKGTVYVDWGDGTALETVTGTSLNNFKSTTTHEYEHGGDYVIKITVVTGEMVITGSNSKNVYCKLFTYSATANVLNTHYMNAIRRIEIGTGVEIGSYAFYYCRNLTNIIIPNNTTTIGSYAFYYNVGLESVTIPNSMTTIESYAFEYCYRLRNVSIPNNITTINAYSFTNCYALANIIIPNSVTSIGARVFQSCYNLTSITISENMQSISAYAFDSAIKVENIILPDNITTLGQYGFANIFRITNITIPKNVTRIESYTFQNLYGMAECHFQPTTPPTLTNTNAFGDIPSDCIFYVPYSEDHSILNAYKTATNWSTYASRMVEEEPT